MLRGFTRSVSSCLLYRARGEVGQVWMAVRGAVRSGNFWIGLLGASRESLGRRAQ